MRGPDAKMMFDLATVPLELALVAVAAAVLGAIAGLRIARLRRRVRHRIIEKPNSHYTSQLARNSESRHRWHNIDLDRIHEVNRVEVERLLARVEATSVDALRPNEVLFLDRMAELAGPASPPDPRDSTPPIVPDLRHRPA